MSKKFLGAAFCILLFLVASALPLSDKDGEGRLVTVDENSKKSIQKEVLSSENFAELGESQKTLIKTVVATFWNKYLEKNSYPMNESDVSSMMDSLSVLRQSLAKAEEEVATLDGKIASLEVTTEELDGVLDSLAYYSEAKSTLNKEISEKRLSNDQLAQEVAPLEEELALLNQKSSAQKESISELVRWKESLLGEYREQKYLIDNAVLTAHKSKVSNVDTKNYPLVKETYMSILPVMSVLDIDWTAEVEKELDYMDELGRVGKSLSEANFYLSGPFDNATRLRICNDLISQYQNLKYEEYYSDEQLDEFYYVMQATGAQGGYRDKLYNEIVSPLYKLGSISETATFESWLNKIRGFKEEMESEDKERNMIWPHCKTLVAALSEIGELMRWNYGHIPNSVSDPNQFKARLKKIWGNVESKELR